MSWKTLVLDKSYQPVEIISWTEAITLLVLGKAEIVEEYEDVEIRSARLTFKLPSILRLLKSFKQRKAVKFSRYNIFYRDKWKCQYCGDKKKSEDLTFDHVIPKSRKTPDSHKTWENIVAACISCNRRKGGRTPQEAGMKLLKKPVKPDWSPSMTIRLKENDPESWRNYIYWHVELEPT